MQGPQGRGEEFKAHAFNRQPEGKGVGASFPAAPADDFSAMRNHDQSYRRLRFW